MRAFLSSLVMCLKRTGSSLSALKSAFSSRDKMASAFRDYVTYMQFASKDTTITSINKLIKEVQKKPQNMLTLAQIAEETLYGDSALFWSDELYLQFTNAANSNNAPNAFTIYASNDNSSYSQLGSFTNTVQTANATWDVDLSSNTGFYQYYKVEFTQWNGASTGGRGVKEIVITATQKTITEGTSSNYDYYEDINEYMAIA